MSAEIYTVYRKQTKYEVNVGFERESDFSCDESVWFEDFTERLTCDQVHAGFDSQAGRALLQVMQRVKTREEFERLVPIMQWICLMQPTEVEL